MMQLVIKTDLDKLPAAIEANFPEIRAELETLLARYDGLLVDVGSRDAIAAAKKDCADLNRLAVMLDEARKRVKAKCLKPYADFEARIKELVGMIADAREPIDRQLKEADRRRREERAAALADFYAAEHSSIAAVVPFARIFDKAWTNVTVSEQTAREAIDAKAQEITNALGAIQDTAPEEFRREAANRYAENLDLAGTLSWLRERKERDAAIAAAVQARPVPQPAAKPISADSGAASDGGATTPTAETTAEAPESASPSTEQADGDRIQVFTLRLRWPRSRLFELRAWMNQRGLTYEKLD